MSIKVKLSQKGEHLFNQLEEKSKQNLITFYDKDNWYFTGNDENIKQIIFGLSLVEESKCNHMSIPSQFINQNLSLIIQHLTKISFLNLTSINISCSQLMNFQFMQQMDLPSLSGIFICNQLKISNLKSFHKWNLPSLKILNIQNNPIKDLSSFNRFRVHSKKLQSIVLQFNHQQPIIMQDISVLFKIQAVQLNRIRISSSDRIKCQKLRNVFRQNRFNQNCTIYG